MEGCFLSFGGSRVTAAREVGLTVIPALVNDYVERYKEAERVTPENVRSFFTDVPEYIEFTSKGLDTHYSLERNRRDEYDPAGMEWAMIRDNKIDGLQLTFIGEEFPWI